MENNVFFNLDGTEKSFELSESFTRKGNASNVFLINGGTTVLKIYIDDESKPLFWRIDYEVFEFLKANNFKQIISLQELLYAKKMFNILDKFRTMRNPKKRIVDAYTYDFVPGINSRLVDMPKDYLLESINALETIAICLAHHKLAMEDLNVDNVVYNEEGMILLDPDLFKFYRNMSEVGVLQINKRNLLELFRKIIIEERTKDEIGLEVLFKDIDNQDELASQISKRLINCKIPRDFSKNH